VAVRGAPVALTSLRRNRDFVLLQSGQVISSIGSQCTSIALPLLTLALTHSATKTGVIGFLELAPLALFMLIAGVAADRWNRKSIMIVSSAIRLVSISSVVIAIALDAITFAHLAVVAFVQMTCASFYGTASEGAVRSVVPQDQLETAAGAIQTRVAAARLTGPPLGGALFGFARLLPFLADAISYVVSIVSLAAIRAQFQEPRERDAAPLHTQVAEGFRFLWSEPFLRTSALIFTLGNIVSPGSLLIAIVIIGKRQGLSSAEIGALNAGMGVALLAGSLVASRVTRRFSRRAILVGELWSSCACGVFLLHPSVYLLLVGILPQSFVIPSTDTALTAYRYRLIPDRLLGRVIGVITNVAVAVTPLGPLAIGLLLSHTTERVTVGSFAALALVLAVWGTLSPSLRVVTR
jgi:MFS family permease